MVLRSSIETVYGLGANALNRDAVCDIFKAKNRPFNGGTVASNYNG